ncbi:glycine-rich domain-containing protein [Streptomyces sp. NPDC048291]|uniref:glycine-rich domain-containing protein n=1 Tax=Streptomyces sp. NPDC048291 TaxID=3365530 RepID=UPI0037194718
MTATVNDLKTGRAVAGEELFESLAHFVVVHNGQSPERAARIADQAVAFLVTAATANVPMVPSDDVDLGLHALILHTREYARLCDRYAGRFLHHNPKPGGGPRDLLMVITAARAMKAAGFKVFDDLWTVDGTNLAQCDSDCGRPYGQDYQD